MKTLLQFILAFSLVIPYTLLIRPLNMTPVNTLTATEQLLDGFLADRSPETFVYTGPNDVTTWLKEYSGTDSHGAFLLSGELISDSDIHRTAYRLGQARMTSMGFGNLPLRLHPEEAFTNGRHVTVSTAMLEKNHIPLATRLDIFLGEVVHEVLHLKYTDFNSFSDSKLKNSIMNIIEDERIERLGVNETPGYRSCLEACKVYHFADRFHEFPETPGGQILDCFLKLVRFPSSLNPTLVDLHLPVLLEIKDALIPYPSTFSEALDATEKVYAILLRYYSEEDDSDQESGTAKPGNKMNATAERLEKELASVLEVLTGLFDANHRSDDQASRWVENDELKLMEMYGKVEQHVGDNKIVVTRVSNNTSNYMEALAPVRPQAAALAALLNIDTYSYDRMEQGLRSGDLDTNKLAEIRAHSPFIYQREEAGRSRDFVAALLIDMSGSMRGAKIKNAQQVAVLFQEALRRVPRALRFIFGHTTTGLVLPDGSFRRMNEVGCSLAVFEEPGSRQRHSLGNISAYEANYDGIAIREVVRHVRARTQQRGFLIVISDGKPTYQDGLTDTRKAVLEAQAQGIIPIQIAIESNEEDSAAMFDHYVQFTDSANMLHAIGPLIRKAIRKHVLI
jgi:hypothetical protein